MKQEAILVSACLLGTPCRYDGNRKPNAAVRALGERYRLIPVCPEVMGGLPTPRLPSERVGDRVLRSDGVDVTAEYCRGAESVLNIALCEGCHIAILKERSPACGCGRIYDGSFSGILIPGNGVAADLLLKAGLWVAGESEVEAGCLNRT